MLQLNHLDYEHEAVAIDSDAATRRILVDVLELNELLDDIETPAEVESMELKLEETMSPFQKELEHALQAQNFKLAVNIVAKMKYYKNIDDRLKELKLKFCLND